VLRRRKLASSQNHFEAVDVEEPSKIIVTWSARNTETSVRENEHVQFVEGSLREKVDL